MRAILLLALLLLMPTSLMSKKPGSSEPPATGNLLDAGRWNFLYGQDTGTHPEPLSGMFGWSFQFPHNPGYVAYIITPYTVSLGSKSVLTFTAQVVAEDGTRFRYDIDPGNVSGLPANVRAIIRSNKGGEFNRWWSNPLAMILENGVATVTTPLTADQWSSVNGKFGNSSSSALKGFKSAISRPSSIGLTFGGGSFFGHGVYTENGNATFILTNYAVQ
jgi:hypothetical protein